ncbi:hypothetical protein ACOMHN_011512 [Nucella lapillus]
MKQFLSLLRHKQTLHVRHYTQHWPGQSPSAQRPLIPHTGRWSVMSGCSLDDSGWRRRRRRRCSRWPSNWLFDVDKVGGCSRSPVNSISGGVNGMFAQMGRRRTSSGQFPLTEKMQRGYRPPLPSHHLGIKLPMAHPLHPPGV